ncbi:glycosyltransferase family 8 protein [Sphingosinicellaceae bacterium]|nr:glycosyltransferase family 8 protein [Sphingosinicellaceae bacterium]
MMTIHCAFSSDDNYFQHLAVAITSLLENNRHHEFVLHVVHGEVSETKRAMLSTQVARYPNATLHLYEFDDAPYRHFRLDSHITLASYFRLFLTEILPPEIDRVLYLDADIVVLGDVAPLWETAFDNCLIAAAPNIFSQNNERLGLPRDYCYFNAGILVVDLAGWRREGLLRRFVDYVERNHMILRWHDQDALNAVLHDRVRYVDYGWNFQARTQPTDAAALSLDASAFRRLRKQPQIVHFTTEKKPWLYAYRVPFEAEYHRYLKLTPWRSYVPPDKSFKSWTKRNFPRAPHYFWELKRRASLLRARS